MVAFGARGGDGEWGVFGQISGTRGNTDDLLSSTHAQQPADPETPKSSPQVLKNMVTSPLPPYDPTFPKRPFPADFGKAWHRIGGFCQAVGILQKEGGARTDIETLKLLTC